MKWKKVISILLAAVLCMSFLMGCNNSSATSGTASNQDPQKQADKATKELNSKMDNGVELEFVEKKAYDPSYEELDAYFYTDKDESLSFAVIFDKYTNKFIGVSLDKGIKSSVYQNNPNANNFEVGKENLDKLSIFNFIDEDKAEYQKRIHAKPTGGITGFFDRRFFEVGENFHVTNQESDNKDGVNFVRVLNKEYEIW